MDGPDATKPGTTQRSSLQIFLGFFDLPVFQVHEGIATEDADGDAEFAALGIDLFDEAVLVLERAVGNLHLVANLKLDLRFYGILAVAYLRKQAINFLRTHRNRAVLGAGEAEDTIGFLDEIPGLVNELVILIEEMHIDDDVAGEKLPSGLGFFATLDFLNALGGNEDFVTRSPISSVAMRRSMFSLTFASCPEST